MSRRVCAILVVFLVIVGLLNPSVAIAQEIELESHGAVLMDATSGEILFEKNADDPLPPASVTKLMTLLLAFEALQQQAIQPDDDVRASAYAASLGGSQIWLEPGEVMPLEDLIKAVAVRSANDAAAALGEHVAGTHEQFVARMNEKAAEIGMVNTHFVNAHGLYHPEHLMSARDVALLSRYIVLHYPVILDYTGRWDDRIRVGTEDEQWLVNTNKMIQRYSGVDGLKTGWSGSESGWCVSATAKRDDTRMIAVIMKGPNSKKRFEEAEKLLNYGFANFESVKVADGGAVMGTLVVDEGVEGSVDAVLPDTLGATVRKGQASNLEQIIALDEYVTAPIAKGDKVGEVIMKLGDEVVAQADLVAAKDVKRVSWFRLMLRNFRRSFPLEPPK